MSDAIGATFVLAIALGLGSVSQSVLADDASASDETPTVSQSADATQAAQYFGFLPVEVFKLSERAEQLQSADLNHDGLLDVLAVDNSQNRLILFLRKPAVASGQVSAGGDAPKAAATSARAASAPANRVNDPEGFEVLKLPVLYAVTAVATGDFNGDGRTDIAYFGPPDHLVLMIQPESGPWTEKHEHRVPDVSERAHSMAAADLTADGRDDLILAGPRYFTLMPQRATGLFDSPRRILNSGAALIGLATNDVNGDGRKDLVYVAGESGQRVLCVRLQLPTGMLGAEWTVDIAEPRSWAIGNLDGQAGDEVAIVDNRTGRVVAYHLEMQPRSADEPSRRLMTYGLGEQSSGRVPDLVLTDITGDGKLDVVVTDPSGSRIIVFEQMETGLNLGRPFASLVGVDKVRAATWLNAGQSQLLVSSPSEKLLGFTRWEDNRLAFPVPTSLDVEPLALELLPAEHGPPKVLIVNKTGKERGAQLEVSLMSVGADGRLSYEKLPPDDQRSFSVALKHGSDRLLVTDLNRDQNFELIFTEGASNPPEVFELFKSRISGGVQLPAAAGTAFTPTTWKGQPALLVAGSNYARFMTLDAERQWQILDQVNCGETNSDLAAARLLEIDGAGSPELVLVDRGLKKLRLWRLDGADSYQPWREVELGDFSFRGMTAGDVTGDGREDLVIWSNDRFGVLPTAGDALVARELASFETDTERPYFADLAIGDLNGDGRAEISVADTRHHSMELIEYRTGRGLSHGLTFQVFEYKSFANEDDAGSEPRQVQIGDANGDGRPDLLLLVHDRLLIYPQDAGSETDAAAPQADAGSAATSGAATSSLRVETTARP